MITILTAGFCLGTYSANHSIMVRLWSVGSEGTACMLVAASLYYYTWCCTLVPTNLGENRIMVCSITINHLFPHLVETGMTRPQGSGRSRRKPGQGWGLGLSAASLFLLPRRVEPGSQYLSFFVSGQLAFMKVGEDLRPGMCGFRLGTGARCPDPVTEFAKLTKAPPMFLFRRAELHSPHTSSASSSKLKSKTYKNLIPKHCLPCCQTLND